MLFRRILFPALLALANARPYPQSGGPQNLTIDDDLVDGVDQGTQNIGTSLGNAAGAGVGTNNTAGNNNGNGNSIGNGNNISVNCGPCHKNATASRLIKVRQVLDQTNTPPTDETAPEGSGPQGSPNDTQAGVINLVLECC